MVAQSTVPDFFQEETTDALRSQVEWLTQEIGVDNSFFARLVGTDEVTFSKWRACESELPPGGEDTLRQFWGTMGHLLSFMNFDVERIRGLFEHVVPTRKEGYPSLVLPWSGSSLKKYFERSGSEGIEKVGRWVTGLRFGDPYTA